MAEKIITRQPVAGNSVQKNRHDDVRSGLDRNVIARDAAAWYREIVAEISSGFWRHVRLFAAVGCMRSNF